MRGGLSEMPPRILLQDKVEGLDGDTSPSEPSPWDALIAGRDLNAFFLKIFLGTRMQGDRHPIHGAL